MIARDDVMPMLRAACPSFDERWRQYVADPAFEGELLYVHLGEFAHHLVRLLKAGETSEFVDVFAVVEALQVDGDAYVREATTLGLLEGIQNVAGNNGLDPESFLSYLQVETARWWRKLNAFWDGDGTALRD